jgi:arylsulfatase
VLVPRADRFPFGERTIPFQQGSSLNAAGINYNSLKATQAMRRLMDLESLPAPHN